MKTVFDDGIEKVVFNGILYLAKNRHYSRQYIGSGKTYTEAVNDMFVTIKKHNLKLKKEYIT